MYTIYNHKKQSLCTNGLTDDLTQGSTFFFPVKSQTGQTLNVLNRGVQMVPVPAILQCQHTENIYYEIWNGNPPALFFMLRIALTIWGLL